LLSGKVSAYKSIPVTIISGGEVAIMEVKARDDGQIIAVSGQGFEIFPRQTCGYLEIMFVDANERILLRKDVPYQTSYSYVQSPRTSFEDRAVSFSVKVPASMPAVTSVFVRHRSTGGCEHSWSLQYALEWLIDKVTSFWREKPSETDRLVRP
jgi:hypothetical protein